MAGSMIFSDENAIGMSTFQFRCFSRLVRDAFLPGEEAVLEEVFDPLDEGALNYLYAADLEGDRYLILCGAINRAHSAGRKFGDELVDEGLWAEILDAMAADSRYRK